jgi:predicted nuclease of restriction endonuclease-like (RecB) superfamily
MELLPSNYATFLANLKEQIRQAQTRAALSVNRELVQLYWEIGQGILKAQAHEGWGSKVIERLAQDLRQAFPDMKGFSPRNLKYMRSFAEAYPNAEFVQQLVALLPWGHNVRLLDKVSEPTLREWYARKTIEPGWSRAILEAQIETNLHLRQGAAPTNFSRTLPSPQSELAQQALKDPYNFSFLSLHDEAIERNLEKGLLEHLQKFILELGVGFALVGSQYRLEIDGKDYALDLLFYHYKLHCFVVIDLKMTEFKPEHAGKMNFYLSAVDDLLRQPQDAPSIGLILCKTKSKMTVEYALRDMNKPLGISSFQLAEILPKELQGSLPTIEQLEAELEKREKD